MAQLIRIKDRDPRRTPKRTRTTKKIRAQARSRRRVTKGLSLSVLFSSPVHQRRLWGRLVKAYLPQIENPVKNLSLAIFALRRGDAIGSAGDEVPSPNATAQNKNK